MLLSILSDKSKFMIMSAKSPEEKQIETQNHNFQSKG